MMAALVFFPKSLKQDWEQALTMRRTVNTKYGETQVCDAYLEDDSGRIKFTIWGEDIQKVKNGDSVAIENGYTTTFRNEVQLNKSRNSKMEVTPS